MRGPKPKDGSANDAKGRDGSRLASELTLPKIETRLQQYAPSQIRARRRAAVAIILRFRSAEPEALLMERAQNAEDRWSGHISLPGGRVEAKDDSPAAAAIRETREEVGLHLDSNARLLGTIDDQRVITRIGRPSMAITPHVFVQTRDETLALGQEAAAAFWLPLAALADKSIAGRHPVKFGPLSMKFPCWEFKGYAIWGLTYQMLARFLKIVA